MMKIRIIRTQEDYRKAMAQLDSLMDAAPGSPEEEELDLVSFLIEKYEEVQFPIELPDPVEAIKFRMEQQGLTRKDLVKFIGSQSKVSEILNHKRPLSLAMIRALHKELGIPADVLLKEPGKQLSQPGYNPQEYPINEMYKAGYFPQMESLYRVKENAEELLDRLLAPLRSLSAQRIYCRHAKVSVSAADIHNNKFKNEISEKPNDYIAVELESINENALIAWQARVMQIAEEQIISEFSFEMFTKEFMRNIIHLSVFSNGPLLAQEALLASGIHFVILPHLTKTYLDGACFMGLDKKPIIAMTLRHDRLDNFWYTLAHELAHVFLHLKNNYAFFDDTEKGGFDDCDQFEKEANDLCVEILIPGKEWQREKERLLNTIDEKMVISFANRVGISPAIVAGRARWERKEYSIFTNLVGNGYVKRCFINNVKV